MSSKDNNRQRWFRAKVLFAITAALMASGYPGHFLQETNAQEERRVRNEAGDMECISYCSPSRPGTVIMEVKWRLADHSLGVTELQATASQQGLDVTVYRDGFDRGLYVSVPSVKPKAVFRMPATTPALLAERKPPGLEKLVITGVATRADKPSTQFLLLPPTSGAAADAEWFTVRMEGLDPGMEYTYRVPGGKSVVTCQAVVCPVDKPSAPPSRGKRKAPRRTQ